MKIEEVIEQIKSEKNKSNRLFSNSFIDIYEVHSVLIKTCEYDDRLSLLYYNYYFNEVSQYVEVNRRIQKKSTYYCFPSANSQSRYPIVNQSNSSASYSENDRNGYLPS